jgi:transcriptional regulator with XRE-family HTH domain
MDHDGFEANDILTTLGRNLKAARLSAGLTQQQLAARAGVGLTRLAQIESGCRDPDLKLLGALAKAVRRSVRRLLST